MTINKNARVYLRTYSYKDSKFDYIFIRKRSIIKHVIRHNKKTDVVWTNPQQAVSTNVVGLKKSFSLSPSIKMMAKIFMYPLQIKYSSPPSTVRYTSTIRSKWSCITKPKVHYKWFLYLITCLLLPVTKTDIYIMCFKLVFTCAPPMATFRLLWPWVCSACLVFISSWLVDCRVLQVCGIMLSILFN